MRHTSRKTIVNATQCTFLNSTHCRRYRGVNATPRIGSIKQHVLAVALSIVCALCFSNTSAAANNGPEQTKTYHLDLPEQTVATALNSLSEQTDIQVLFPYDIAAQLTSEPLLGRFSIELALERLLRDTGLHGGLTSSGVITISQTGSESTTNQNGKGKTMNSKNSTTRKTLLAGLVGLFAAGGATQVAAQGGEVATGQSEIDEIIVTATKRETSLQDTALSVSVLSGEGLSEIGVTNFVQLLGTVPGATVVESGSGYSTVSFRGIATSNAVLGNKTTSTYIDEFPIALGDIDIKMVDISQVEVLKGPQGTLYGQSAMGGVMRFITNKPDTEAMVGGVDFTAESVASGGTGYQGQGYINMPLSESVAVRGVLYNYDSAGFIDNLGIGAKDVNTEEVTGGRLALRWDLSERTAFNLLYLNQSSRLGGGQALNGQTPTSTYTPTAIGVPSDIQPPNLSNPSFRSNYDSFAEFKFEALNIKLDINFDDFDLSVMGATKKREWLRVSDLGIWLGIYDDITNTFSNLDQQYEGETLEFRLVSSTEGPVEWIAGIWYESEDGAERNEIQMITPRTDLFGGFVQNGDFIFDRKSFDDMKELAIYGEVGYRFSNSTKLTLGYRRADLELDSGVLRADGLFDGGEALAIGVPEDVQEDIDTYKVHFEYRLSDQALTYALASSGYRAGGFNRSGLSGLSPASQYDTDTIWNYEIGVRLSSMDNRLVSNIVAYYLDWSDIQLRAWDVDAFVQRIQNVGKAEVFGLETEIGYQVTEALKLTANYAYIDATMKETYEDTSTTPPTVIAEAGTRLPGSSKHAVSLFVDWQKSMSSGLDLLVNANYRYVSSRPNILGLNSGLAAAFTDDIPSAEVVNLSASIQHSNGVSASLFANNLFDKRNVQYQAAIGTALQGSVVNRPRTIGLRLGYQF